MSTIIYVIPVIVVIIISAIVVKIASVALKLTGLSERVARFQALSAFTGTGFTTKDSELILDNFIRRRIVMVLMILGNAGLVSAITALVISFGKGGLKPTLVNSSILLILLFLFYKFATHKTLMRFLTKKIEAGLEKQFRKRPVEEILHIAQGYGIAEVLIKETCHDLGKKLTDSSFRDNDILILAIEGKNGVIPTPHASDIIELNDILICYGKLENIKKIL